MCQNWELKGKLPRAGEFTHPNTGELGQVREEVECELGRRKQEPGIQGRGGSGYPYMERRERVACLGPESRMAGASL